MEKYQNIISPISQELEQCKTIYRSACSENNPLLNSILDFIRQKEGKMMRPILTLLCAKLFGDIDTKAVFTAVSYEFFHTATLVHDDVVDESNERRGQPSVNASFNNKRAVLIGDYILSRSLFCLSQADEAKLISVVSQAAGSLADGELLQLASNGRYQNTEDYLRIITNKTAALFRACAESGAIISGACNEDIATMRLFGEYVGICFQIKDDLLDKEIDTEIANQMITKYTELAKSLLDKYPDTLVKQSLLDYVDYVSDRKF